MDSYKLYAGTISPEKFGLNLGMTAVGLAGGPPGAVVSIWYFGVDAAYEGNWSAYGSDLVQGGLQGGPIGFLPPIGMLPGIHP
jgi:hypothetical protein